MWFLVKKPVDTGFLWVTTTVTSVKMLVQIQPHVTPIKSPPEMTFSYVGLQITLKKSCHHIFQGVQQYAHVTLSGILFTTLMYKTTIMKWINLQKKLIFAKVNDFNLSKPLDSISAFHHWNYARERLHELKNGASFRRMCRWCDPLEYLHLNELKNS